MYYLKVFLFISLCIFASCNNKEFHLYKLSKHQSSEHYIQDDIFQISKDSILYYIPQKPMMYLAKGKLKIKCKQAIFESEFNVDSINIIVDEKRNNRDITCFKLSNKNKKLGAFGPYGYVDDINKFTLVINNNKRFQIKDSLILNISYNIVSFYIEYETFRQVKNKTLRTKDFYVKDVNSNYFNIETFFNDYLVFATKRTDTLTFLPFYRIKIGEKKYRRIFILKEDFFFHNHYGYDTTQNTTAPASVP